MKRTLCIALVLVAGTAWMLQRNPSVVSASPKNIFTPDTIQWGPPPPFVAPGAQLAVLEGNPMASTGDYTIRLKMPAGYKIAPHLASAARKRDRHLRDLQSWHGRSV